MLFFGSRNQKRESIQQELEKNREILNEVSSYLNDFLAFLPLAICDVSPKGVIVNINKAFERLTGFSEVEIVGEDLTSIFLEQSKINNLLQLATRKKFIQQEELTLVSKEKKKIKTSVSFATRKDSFGNLTGFFVSITDITQFKELQTEMEKKIQERTKDLEESRKALLNILEDTEEARRKAEEEKKKTEAIIKNFVDGLLVFDDQKKVILINPKAEEFLNIWANEILEKEIQEIKEINKRCRILYKTVGKEIKEVFRKEMPITSSLILEVTTSPISYEKGKNFTLVILHDISREKLVEQMKSQFVSVAAHQLRTPLSIIKWSLSLLIEEGNLNEEEKDLVTKAYQTNDRMINLVNDLLNVARIEEGRLVYQPKIVEFAEIVQSVCDSLKDFAAQKNIEFSFKNTKDKKIVKVDVEKLSLAVKNLVENALRYTPEGGKVTITLQRKGKEVLFSVKDTGVGIPKDQQDRIFTKFFRGANVIRMQTEGSGLGLFITKNIIEAHKGKIWFKSKENKGTTFYFTLPLVL